MFINLDKYQKQADNHLGCLQLGARLITEFENGLKKFSLNLGVSAMMKFINQINATKQYSPFVLKTFVKILSFYAPHLAEELWFQVFGQRQSVYLAT